MKQEIKDLIDVSRFYGRDKDYVIAGGGNTSYKDDEHLWVKASGAGLADITEDGFVVMDRKKLAVIPEQDFSDDPVLREQQVKEALYASRIDPGSNLRPSVETSLHDVIKYSYVVHLHPTLVNALMCSAGSRALCQELFADALYIPYTDPGYTLFMKVYRETEHYRKNNGCDPSVIFLENHGVFVGADSVGAIKKTYEQINDVLSGRVREPVSTEPLGIDGDVTQWLPALRMLFSSEGLKTCSLRHNEVVARFYRDKAAFSKVSLPFTPDMIVYCGSGYLYVEHSETPADIIASVKKDLPAFVGKHGCLPKIVVIKNVGFLAVDDTWQAAQTCLDVYEDLMKVSYLAGSFGGHRFMTGEQIRFIENWEAEHYRRKQSKGPEGKGKVHGRVAVVTGGAMGFGAGIVESLAEQEANVVIADISEDAGKELARVLSSKAKNGIRFVYTDVGVEADVGRMVKDTVASFGGLDLMISNAGILHAGTIEEMQTSTFERMTRVNYFAYFHCVKHAAAVMKVQHAWNKTHFCDIIQINSKSGLAGSNKNFAYAGGKFGGIGLTQSFALELMPYNIKVNAICPGNFFEGPLWADPDTGLFVQYLRAGKVPGAENVDDVKKHYERQVPAGRGCRVEDVARAIYYLIEQEYETGQALPVTGGQVMLH